MDLLVIIKRLKQIVNYFSDSAVNQTKTQTTGSILWIIFSLANLHPEDELITAVGWLKDNARASYVNHQRKINSWKQLKEFLSERYMVHSDILRKRLMNLKQKTSIQDYVFEFETFVNNKYCQKYLQQTKSIFS